MTCPSDRHGCYNRELTEVLKVQDGWTSDGRRVVRDHITGWSTWCRYDQRQTDAKCAGCRNGGAA